MTIVKTKLRPSTVDGRPGTIVYFVTHRHVIRQITTVYKLFSCEWDKKRSRPVVVFNNERTAVILRIAQMIDKDLERLNGIIEKFARLRYDYSSEDIIKEFQRTGKENTIFIFMENVIERLRQLRHIGTVKNYRAALSSFKRFLNNVDVPLEAIDQITMEDYQAYLKSSGLTPNSISFYMRILRAVYNRAVEQDLCKDRTPFRTVFTGTEKTLKRAISISDIRQIKNLDLEFKPNLEFARDIFLFLFLCRGISFIDAAFLKRTDIQNGMLTYRRHKTNQVLHIKIIKPIKELIDRYSNKNSHYLLPIITRSNSNERKQYEAALRRVNNALKIIASSISQFQ